MRVPTERLLRLPDVLDMVGLGKTTIYDMMKHGDFPRPRRVRNLSLWVESEVQDWIRTITGPSSAATH
ncbi:AlpA family phage regulatory protein [Burkholderia cenocepacia]|uniref:helix-turn-helix transcriptional regulator n=1 Tax=Burkholderia cenocepacia TaxID=95486 RepID=UPI001AA1959A|nr:AlpA family phage regulatory protein [Burkholderia cenocepacia]